MSAFGSAYRGKTVLVTGHTGFKGAWLAWWLTRLGAKVVGYALPAEANSLFLETGLEGAIAHVEGDVRDGRALEAVFAEHRPEVVFHLAAQSLVRASYRAPADTIDVNVMGTVRVLEAVRQTPDVKACVVVTTDKCYENREWVHPYRETDPLGGHDPYSASKAAAELVTASYRASFLAPERGVGLATARAGNVIGGGDWADERLVPDCARALAEGSPVRVRNPHAIRPWQHVLDSLAGYLWLGARLLESPVQFSEAWNFGPGRAGAVTVGQVVASAVALWGSGSWVAEEHPHEPMHEARFLKLDVAKASHLLDWEPVYGFEEALAATIAWYRAQAEEPGFDARSTTLAQLERFERTAAERGVRWASPPAHAPA